MSSGEAAGAADSSLPPDKKRLGRPCHFWSPEKPEGCRFGDKCSFLHVAGEKRRHKRKGKGRRKQAAHHEDEGTDWRVEKVVELQFWMQRAGEHSARAEEAELRRKALEEEKGALERHNVHLSQQLDATWRELATEVEKLRQRRAEAEEETRALRRAHTEAEAQCEELRGRLGQLSAQKRQLGDKWQETTRAFQAELRRLQDAREAAEAARREAEQRSREAVAELREENERLRVSLERAAAAEEMERLKAINVLALRRVAEQKARVAELEGRVRELRGQARKGEAAREALQEARDEAEVYAQVAQWEKELLVGERVAAEEEAEERRLESVLLRYDQDKLRRQLDDSQRALVAATQGEAELELRIFHLTMAAEIAERERDEMRAEKLAAEREAAEHQREKREIEGALAAAMMQGLQKDREINRLAAEVDYHEYMLHKAHDEMITKQEELDKVAAHGKREASRLRALNTRLMDSLRAVREKGKHEDASEGADGADDEPLELEGAGLEWEKNRLVY